MQQAEQRKNNYELQSPGRRQYPSQYATTAEEYASMSNPELSNVQIAAVWRDIEANIAKYKKDSQSNYKQMLDEQIKHKQMLEKQGTMTQMEKSLNRADLQGFKASETSMNAMIPGLFNESPMRNVQSVPRNMRQ